MSRWPEPPDGSIAGAGDPITIAVVRLDQVAKDGGWPAGRRWFPVEEGLDNEGPMTWDEFCFSHTIDDAYLLVRNPLPGDRR